MPLYTMPRQPSKGEHITRIIAQALMGYTGSREMKKQRGMEERKMTLEEAIGQARIGGYQRQGMPKPELEQLQEELQYWQGVYGRTYEKGMLGGWGEIADPQTKKMAEARISQIGKRIVEMLSGQVTPRKRVESREALPGKPALPSKITPRRTLPLQPTEEPEKYIKPKVESAKKGRIRSWVVPFNLKNKTRLDPKILDAMSDETIEKISKLKPDRLEKALQAILNGTSEQELLAALELEKK